MGLQAIKDKTAMDGTEGRMVLVSNLLGRDWQTVQVAMSVFVVFDADGLPKFRPR
jgi:hypothetical protein